MIHAEKEDIQDRGDPLDRYKSPSVEHLFKRMQDVVENTVLAIEEEQRKLYAATDKLQHLRANIHQTKSI